MPYLFRKNPVNFLVPTTIAYKQNFMKLLHLSIHESLPCEFANNDAWGALGIFDVFVLKAQIGIELYSVNILLPFSIILTVEFHFSVIQHKTIPTSCR